MQIVDIIASRRYPRTQLILPTQYGKSLAVALGVLLRVAHFREKWAIVAPTEDKARIIMDYIIDHIFDDEVFRERLEYYDTKEKLKQNKSKTRLSFRGAGEVRVYTANANNSKEVKKALMGFGAPNIVLDESALIPDDVYATVKRMLGGSRDNFLLEIGNPFFRNHFYRNWFGERYMKIYVDVWMALKEGRYTHDFVNEMKEEAFFDVLYDCLFPDASEVLSNGYRRLISDPTIDGSMIDVRPPTDSDSPILGIDVAAGGDNKTKLILRFPTLNFAFVERTLDSDDLEIIADEIEDVIKEWNIGDYRTVIDAGGVGHGLPAILRARGYLVKSVLFGEAAPEKTFVNIRAWMYWQLRKWLRDGGKLVRDESFMELRLIYYKRNSSDRTQIEPKDDMIKREGKESRSVSSPDTADGLALTFVDTSTIVEESDIDFD